MRRMSSPGSVLGRTSIATGSRWANPIVGDEAKRMLLDEFDREERQERELAEHVAAAEALWRTLSERGVQMGTRGRFVATFVTAEADGAQALAAEFTLRSFSGSNPCRNWPS